MYGGLQMRSNAPFHLYYDKIGISYPFEYRFQIRNSENIILVSKCGCVTVFYRQMRAFPRAQKVN